MSTWLFDLGNTRLKCAPVRADGRAGDAVAVPHDGGTLRADALDEVLPARIDVAHVASVASDAARVALLDALAARAGRISIARTQAHAFGVRVAYARPQDLGVDRYLALVAARARAGAALVCGVGTALTLDLVDADGRHLGGRIAPSPTLMREALHARAPHLPVEGGAVVDFADGTLDGLASGCTGAAHALIAEALRDAEARLGRVPALLLHGGGADALASRWPQALHAPQLVLDGLAIWAAVDAS